MSIPGPRVPHHAGRCHYIWVQEGPGRLGLSKSARTATSRLAGRAALRLSAEGKDPLLLRVARGEGEKL